MIAGDSANPIIDLSSARSEEDELVAGLVPRERSVLEALEDMFASRTDEGNAIPGEIIQDVPTQRPTTRVVFTDAPITFGHGRRKKEVDVGVGLLFPKLMGA